jgi:hypothetical protein
VPVSQDASEKKTMNREARMASGIRAARLVNELGGGDYQKLADLA